MMPWSVLLLLLMLICCSCCDGIMVTSSNADHAVGVLLMLHQCHQQQQNRVLGGHGPYLQGQSYTHQHIYVLVCLGARHTRRTAALSTRVRMRAQSRTRGVRYTYICICVCCYPLPPYWYGPCPLACTLSCY